MSPTTVQQLVAQLIKGAERLHRDCTILSCSYTKGAMHPLLESFMLLCSGNYRQDQVASTGFPLLERNPDGTEAFACRGCSLRKHASPIPRNHTCTECCEWLVIPPDTDVCHMLASDELLGVIATGAPWRVLYLVSRPHPDDNEAPLQLKFAARNGYQAITAFAGGKIATIVTSVASGDRGVKGPPHVLDLPSCNPVSLVPEIWSTWQAITGSKG